MSETDIVAELRRRGFADELEIQRVHEGPSSKAGKTVTTTIASAASTTTATTASTTASSPGAAGGFSYLLDMPIYSLTDERSMQLQQRALEASEKLKQITSKSVDDLWLADLDNLSSAYEHTYDKNK